jgi:copper oxidase (laccase) domain-containing protein
MSGDDVDRVDENRRRLCAEIGADPPASHSTGRSTRRSCTGPSPGARASPGDGLWTEEPDVPILALTADCLPIALARVGGDRPASPFSTSAGGDCWPGIVAAGSEGAREAGCTRRSALRSGRAATRSAPRSRIRSQPRSAPDVLRGRKLDSVERARTALREAGVEEVERVDLCTHCNPELFFSHRRTRLPRGGQGVIARVA